MAHSLNLMVATRMILKPMVNKFRWKMPNKTMTSSFRTISNTPVTVCNGYLTFKSKYKLLELIVTLIFNRDPDHSNFEFANFLTGTHNDDETNTDKQEYLNLIKVRIPKLRQGEKTTIDYTSLDR